MERHYYTINLCDKFGGTDGYSVCVWLEGEESEDYIIMAAIAAGVIDAEDTDDFNVNVEDITDDEYEMKHWVNEATEII